MAARTSAETPDRPHRLERLRAAVELSRLPSVGAAAYKELIDRHGSPVEALAQVPRQIDIAGLEKKAALTEAQRQALRQLPESVGFTTYGEADYPWLLGRLSEPPPYLFRRGALWPLPPIAVAIVGPRGCSDQGAAFARELAVGLAARGVVVVSGGARGIDTAAHRGALGSGGATVLVTATGIDRVYPRENEDLYQRVRQRGCILTELLPGTPPRRDFFPTRNRIIVGLSDAVVVVEGKLRTGTWSSASHALKQHRPLFVWAGSPRPELRELPDLLVGRGATALSEPGAEAIMKVIKPGGYIPFTR